MPAAAQYAVPVSAVFVDEKEISRIGGHGGEAAGFAAVCR